jgi:hypothetical protein
MSRTARFQETLPRLAMVGEGFVEDQAGLGLGLGRAPALDPEAAAVLRLGVSVAIADALPAIAPVTGLGRVVCAAPDVAIALGYDVEAALEELDDQ